MAKMPSGKKKKILKKRLAARPMSAATKPVHLSLEEWQRALRQESALGEKFALKNVGKEPVFSTYQVRNPMTQGSYRVEMRGEKPGLNYCSCPDFSINTIGTCKHIEFILNRLRRKKLTRTLLKNEFISNHSSVTMRYGSQRRIFISFGKTASDELKSAAQKYFDAEGFLTQRGVDHFGEFMEEAKSFPDKINFHEDAMVFLAQMRDVKIRGSQVDKKFPEGIKGAPWNRLLKSELYPYQKEGALFAAKAGRCLIADEMGLGKTVQAFAASEIMAQCYGIEKALILCPTSLKHQWKAEAEKFSRREAVVIQGLLTARHSQYEQKSFYKIANYDVAHRDLEAIARWSPDLIILDEAQRIKNWKTRLARSVKKLQSPYAMVLTGTPLENRLEELHSIVEFVDRHHLGPLFRFLERHQITDASGKVTGYRELNALGESLKHILIRRKKSDLLTQLPERIDKNYFVPMTKEQMEIHEENREIAARIIAKWRRFKFLSEEDKQRLMMALQNMRMVSDNTYLIDGKRIFGAKIDELSTQLEEILEQKGSKVVIFSQWIKMFELVTQRLDRNKLKYVWLHGGVPGNKRGDLIAKFHEDPDCRIFLSTEAGGVGLNLQCASAVINLDLPWNPAVLEQRIGRVHRMGQKNPVRVINFISEGSIEHGILGLLKFKKSMFSGVLDQGENEIFLGTSRFSQFMKTVESATDPLRKQEENADQVRSEAKADANMAGQEISDEPGNGKDREEAVDAPSIRSNADAFKNLLEQGSKFLSHLSRQLENGDQKHGQNGQGIQSFFKILKDENNGNPVLQVAMPDKAAMEKIAEAGKLLLSSLEAAWHSS